MNSSHIYTIFSDLKNRILTYHKIKCVGYFLKEHSTKISKKKCAQNQLHSDNPNTI